MINKISLIILTVILLISCDKTQSNKPQDLSLTDSLLSTKQDQLIQQKILKDNPIIIAEKRDTSIITHIAYVKTNLGDFTLGLYGKEAPMTVENFVGLVKNKYYDGILIHRVAYNFLIQAGDKNTKYKNKKNEWGKGGESFFGEPFRDELFEHTTSYKNGYQIGTLAMANKGPNTNTSQFFICLKEAVKLKNKYTIFGRVLEGMSTIDKISSVEIIPSQYDAYDGIPVNPVIIKSITVTQNVK